MTAPFPGSPTWLELTTDRPDAVRPFFSELLGWTFTDTPMPGFALVHKDDTLVAALVDSTSFPNFAVAAESVPNAWTIYLAVPDLDAALARVSEAGGSALSGAVDVEGQGRFAIVLDPGGACVGLWEHSSDFGGLEFPLVTGTPVWFETLTKEYDAAVPFYQEVLGWDVVPMDSDEEQDPEHQGPRYATNGPHGSGGAGICDAAQWLPADTPSFWRAYFLVEDTDAAVETVRRLGGQLLDGPTDSPFGRVATVTDPSGAEFQVVDGRRG